MNQDVSYDVYVKIGENWAGHDQWSEAIAHFHDEGNALAYQRQLEAQRETVHAQKATIQGFSEIAKENWFEDCEVDY